MALQFTSSGQQIVRDAELPGFFVMVGKRTKTFMVQGDLRQNGKPRESETESNCGGNEFFNSLLVSPGTVSQGNRPRIGDEWDRPPQAM